jgi:hypothetical protein
MKGMKNCRALSLASLLGWLLLMPPFSVTPAGKTFVDTKAALDRWEVFSEHPSATECRKHRDDLRAQLEKSTAAEKDPDKSKQAFATLKERAASARCVASDDPKLHRPAPTRTPHARAQCHENTRAG